MPTTKIDQRLQKIQSLFRRRDFKKAYKEAVFVTRQSGDSEVHSLMVASLWEWIKEQFHRDQFADAKANIQELLRYPNLPATMQSEFPPIFRVLGLNSLLPEELRQDTSSPEAQIELADLYLLKGNKTGDFLPETVQDADRVRLAFGKIECEQDEDALELLKSISFRSPLAEWRLFLRGLIDHYRGDDVKAAESWKRLSPDRPPARIAVKLKNLMHEKSPAAPEHSSSSTGGIISGLFSLFRGKTGTVVYSKTELLDTLRVLDGYMKQGKDKELIGRFQTCKPLFQSEMPMQYARLLQVIHLHILRNASPSAAQQFIDRNLPLPLDPKGNRSRALLSERIDQESHLRRPTGLACSPVYWKKFAGEDIDRIESFSPPMKARNKAAVYHHMAKETHDEFSDAREEAEDEEEFHQMIDVPQTAKKIEDLLDKALTCDPTYIPAYQCQMNLFLEMLPQEERKKPFHPRLVEIHERMLRHVPAAKEALFYLFEYHLAVKDMDAAGKYHTRLRDLDPLSCETLHRRNRFRIGQIREGLRQRKLDWVASAFQELDSGPPLESLYYRYDVLPLALGYIHQVLHGDGSDPGVFFTAAERYGVEKRLPLIFAILAEGLELGLPEKYLAPLQTEWSKGISGRCNGNIAGVLGDLASMILSVQERYPKAMKTLVREACDFVNRAGQVKWNSEKDIFGACSLLWCLAVERQWDGYDKTYCNLTKKWLKQFPHSPLPLFFSAEVYWLETGWHRYRLANKTRELYREFLKRAGSLRNDPLHQFYITTAERKITRIDEPHWGFGADRFDDEYNDDDDEYDDDEDDDVFGDVFGGGLPGGMPFGQGIPPSFRREVKENGGFSAEMRREMENLFPKKFGPLRKLFIDAVEECVVKGLPEDQMMDVLERKMEKLSWFEKMKLMAAMAMSGSLFQRNDDDDDDDDPPTRSRRKNQRKQR
ncbi:MAG: hypothetical protein FWH27_07160 [Planctomycetaceae bacterium]|nr:hypothetical protein [Planctomycetaceae bacterium]